MAVVAAAYTEKLNGVEGPALTARQDSILARTLLRDDAVHGSPSLSTLLRPGIAQEASATRGRWDAESTIVKTEPQEDTIDVGPANGVAQLHARTGAGLRRFHIPPRLQQLAPFSPAFPSPTSIVLHPHHLQHSQDHSYGLLTPASTPSSLPSLSLGSASAASTAPGGSGASLQGFPAIGFERQRTAYAHSLFYPTVLAGTNTVLFPAFSHSASRCPSAVSGPQTAPLVYQYPVREAGAVACLPFTMPHPPSTTTQRRTSEVVTSSSSSSAPLPSFLRPEMQVVSLPIPSYTVASTPPRIKSCHQGSSMMAVSAAVQPAVTADTMSLAAAASATAYHAPTLAQQQGDEPHAPRSSHFIHAIKRKRQQESDRHSSADQRKSPKCSHDGGESALHTLGATRSQPPSTASSRSTESPLSSSHTSPPSAVTAADLSAARPPIPSGIAWVISLFSQDWLPARPAPPSVHRNGRTDFG